MNKCYIYIKSNRPTRKICIYLIVFSPLSDCLFCNILYITILIIIIGYILYSLFGYIFGYFIFDFPPFISISLLTVLNGFVNNSLL